MGGSNWTMSWADQIGLDHGQIGLEHGDRGSNRQIGLEHGDRGLNTIEGAAEVIAIAIG
jgi:hypothetical protein